MKRSSLLLTMAVLMAGLFIISTASAQSGVGLYLTPEQVSVLQGSMVTLELKVMDGLDVNAFDVVINYDQDRLLLTDWQHGEYLTGLFCVHVVEEIGHLELGCTQVAQPAVSGSGTLLSLTFETLVEGEAAVEIASAELADPNGSKSTPWLGDSLIIVEIPTSIPTTTFTPTITATCTDLPTSTKKPKPTASSTARVMPAIPSTGTPTITLTPTSTLSPTWIETEQWVTTSEPYNGSVGLTETAAPGVSTTPLPSFDQETGVDIRNVFAEEENEPQNTESGKEQGQNVFPLSKYWWAFLIAVILTTGLGVYAKIRHH